VNRIGRPSSAAWSSSLGLKAKTPAPPVSKPARASGARELATETIDEMSDPGASKEERSQRRNRLTKGPEEFREARVDRPKPKPKA
jgi:hypothetical protein